MYAWTRESTGMLWAEAELAERRLSPKRISAASAFENWRRMILNNMKS
jgi:hypothetical protein